MTDDIATSLAAVAARGQREIADLTGKAAPLTPDERRRLACWMAMMSKLQVTQRRQALHDARTAKRETNAAPLAEIAALLKDDPEVARLLDAPVGPVAKKAKR